MRFVLDADVDEGGCTSALANRHEVLTAHAGGVHGDDDDVTAYAVYQRAAVVTHDREFTNRRKSRPVGLHVRLKCPEWQAEDLLRLRGDALAEVLERFDDITVTLSFTKMRLFFGNGGHQDTVF